MTLGAWLVKSFASLLLHPVVLAMSNTETDFIEHQAGLFSTSPHCIIQTNIRIKASEREKSLKVFCSDMTFFFNLDIAALIHGFTAFKFQYEFSDIVHFRNCILKPI